MIRNYLTATLPKAFIRLICPKDKEDGEESACMHAHIHPYTHVHTYIHMHTHSFPHTPSRQHPAQVFMLHNNLSTTHWHKILQNEPPNVCPPLLIHHCPGYLALETEQLAPSRAKVSPLHTSKSTRILFFSGEPPVSMIFRLPHIRI